MKMPAKIAFLLLILFNTVMVFANTPPSPPPSTAKGQAVNATPPPPELPINGEFLIGLFMASFLLGMYTIYKKEQKKASV